MIKKIKNVFSYDILLKQIVFWDHSSLGLGHSCRRGCEGGTVCTWRAEAAVGAVTVTELTALGVGAGISTGAATLLVHHVVGTCLSCGNIV